MIINFNGDISKQEVQEMIDAAVDFTTGVLNLSYATSGQVQEALADPNRWLFSIDYSGATYLQKYTRSSSAYTTAYFYVLGAEPTNWRRAIFDRILYAQINHSTYEISIGSNDFVPDVVYNLSNMNAEQLKVLADRFRGTAANGKRFSAVWTYNDYNYVCSAKFPLSPNFIDLMGTAADFNGGIHYDHVNISNEDGTVTHTEYTSNIQLTPVQ